jgi:rubrerythrin
MFISNEELLKASIQIEREGKVFYSELCNYIDDSTTKEFLQAMAKEEAIHEEQFKRILEEKSDQAYGWENQQNLRELLDNKFKTDIFPPINEIMGQSSKFQGIEQALGFAIEAEKVSAEFYGLLGDACDEINVKTQLVQLEKVENEHLDRVKLLSKSYAPKYE